MQIISQNKSTTSIQLQKKKILNRCKLLSIIFMFSIGPFQINCEINLYCVGFIQWIILIPYHSHRNLSYSWSFQALHFTVNRIPTLNELIKRWYMLTISVNALLLRYDTIQNLITFNWNIAQTRLNHVISICVCNKRGPSLETLINYFVVSLWIMLFTHKYQLKAFK